MKKKKYIYIYIYIYNEKRKKNCTEIGMATAQIILQERTLYCEINRCWIVLQHGVG